MNDLRLVEELGRETPLPTPAVLAPARERLLAGLRAASATATRPARLRRRLLAGTVAVGVAASIAGVSLAVSTTPRGGQPPPASATAAEVLAQAASTARAEPDVVPRPDQFVYTELRYRDPTRYQSWRSVDGTRDGLVLKDNERMILPGCRGGRAAILDKRGTKLPATEPCHPDPAYRRDLPTTRDAMLSYLRREAGGGNTNSYAKAGLAMMSTGYVPAASRAALYETIATLPDIRLVPDAVDGAGRRGIGVWFTLPGSGGPGVTLVLDRDSHRFLGTNGDAVVRTAIVDRVGQRM